MRHFLTTISAYIDSGEYDQAKEASSGAVSKCFLFMYFLLPHWVPATWRSRAQTSMRAELPSGKIPTTRVLRRISRFSLSIFMPHSICATYCTLSTIKNRHLRNQSKMTVFCFALEHHLDGEAAAKEIGVRPNLVWWRRGESNNSRFSPLK